MPGSRARNQGIKKDPKEDLDTNQGHTDCIEVQVAVVQPRQKMTIQPEYKTQLFLVASMPQWLERWVQRYDDPCVGGSNPTVRRGCRSFG
jgi:hypothetical protein